MWSRYGFIRTLAFFLSCYHVIKNSWHIFPYGICTHVTHTSPLEGSLSQKLAPFSKCIVGIDIDPAAVELYNNKVSNQGIPSEGQLALRKQFCLALSGFLALTFPEMQAICINLHESFGELNGRLFDVIVVSLIHSEFTDPMTKHV